MINQLLHEWEPTPKLALKDSLGFGQLGRRSERTSTTDCAGFLQCRPAVVPTSNPSHHALRMNPVSLCCSIRGMRAASGADRSAAPINSAPSACLFLELNLCDHHPAVDGLAHVIYGQGGHAHGRQGFHLHARAAVNLHVASISDRVGLDGRERELDAVQSQRMAERNQAHLSAWPP